MAREGKISRTEADDRSSSERATASRGVDQAAEQLASKLARQLGDEWQRGVPRRVEQLLAEHAELTGNPAAVRVVYEEMCLRLEQGERVEVAEYAERFPQWAEQLAVMFEYHELLVDERSAAPLPEAGQQLGDFRLHRELGRGAAGRVFLASQPLLAGRLVVLKVTASEGREHLSLARLQHTHIVPIYAEQLFPEQGWRAVCMPYLGGSTLDRVLRWLAELPMPERDGRQILAALQSLQTEAPQTQPAHSPAQRTLRSFDYVQSLCWIGLCLAEALQYVHERHLVHMDLKPSNVLLAGDGLPMVLDFHLAREPLTRGARASEGVGGTPAYMAPEQRAAFEALRRGEPCPRDLDGRCDIYALGRILYEALAGESPDDEIAPRRLHLQNSQVSTGLSDIVHRCLAPEPADRYGSARALANDLRRHLRNEPLRGVRNRSWRERWRKWRCRSPHALLISAALLVGLSGLGAVAGFAGFHVQRQAVHLQQAYETGHAQLEKRHYDAAVATLEQALARAGSAPGQRPLVRQMQIALAEARRGQLVEQLHSAAEQLRLSYGQGELTDATWQALDRDCERIWQARGEFVQSAAPPEVREQITADLFDLAVLWARVNKQSSLGDRQKADRILADAERLFGATSILFLERQQPLGEADTLAILQRMPASLQPRSPFEHYAVGRWLLEHDQPEEAQRYLREAVQLKPEAFWPHFYTAMCAHELEDAAAERAALNICIALNPKQPACWLNRARLHERAGDYELAERDYSRCIQLAPKQPGAWFERGLLRYERQRHRGAADDLQTALQHGASPAAVHYHLALIHLAQNDRRSARRAVQAALGDDPLHAAAAQLQRRLAAPE